MAWLTENLFGLISLLFGAGGIGYAIVSRFLDRRKYEQEVRTAAADADMKGDDFWKKRYDVLQKEVKIKDDWWKERYDTLYKEFQNERQLSNEIVKSFRSELNEIRSDYEKQRELDKQKYTDLMEQYERFQRESNHQNMEQINRISQLESLVESYEKRLNMKKDGTGN